MGVLEEPLRKKRKIDKAIAKFQTPFLRRFLNLSDPGIHRVEALRSITMHPLDPVEFNQVPQVFNLVARWVGMDKIHYVDLNVIQTIVVCLVEVFAYFTIGSIVANIVEMGLESIHKACFGLAHILDVTFFAGQTVDQV